MARIEASTDRLATIAPQLEPHTLAMRYFPAFLDLVGRDVLVVGGGAVAWRKVRLLADAGASVTVVAKQLAEEFAEHGDDLRLTVIRRGFTAGDVLGKTLAVAATDDPEVNRRVVEAGTAAGVPVNVVDDASISTFVFPAIVQRGEVIVGISSSGAAPVLARRLRAKIEELLPHRLGALASFARQLRDVVRKRVPDPTARLRVWESALEGDVAEAVFAGREEEARARLDTLINRGQPRGSVAIVGAGPGDPELLTVKALRLIQRADVIIYDKLVAPETLGYARRDAQLIYVGKSRGNHTVPQEQINHLIAHHAGQGRRVVRLKGGDPFIFGRGGEELAHLRERGFSVEVVPGVTAASACAAVASVPLTQRGSAEAVVLVTGQGTNGAPQIDWAALARLNQTIAVYMGVAAAPRIAADLIEAGLAPATPVAVVENASLPNERAVYGTIANLSSVVAENAIEGPAVILIGAVAALPLQQSAPEDAALAS
jgi:uroporphyrin-III C-methyltransferase/precorrin-2 dehydrogenase/sirohydrochlorin ferrochelatase